MKTPRALQREVVREIIVGINWMLFVAGLLIGWVYTMAFYEWTLMLMGISLD